MELRALRASDDRSSFSCGEEALDLFFHRFAGQNQFKHHLGVTYVAVKGERILGFATVAPRHLTIDDLPEAERKKLPRYPIPVLGLARLAVDKSSQSLGIGGVLLRFVLKLALEQAAKVGCAGVIVDAKESAVVFYSRYGFVPFEALEGASGARPRPVTMWLSIRAIEAARKP
ncbi:MAG: GNAT family N-acetyltransferase [Deltaproteobacteria bacterium]|nr:GNAT family N-acetyltransferase [Deltaproteobacteria bacterium]